VIDKWSGSMKFTFSLATVCFCFHIHQVMPAFLTNKYYKHDHSTVKLLITCSAHVYLLFYRTFISKTWHQHNSKIVHLSSQCMHELVKRCRCWLTCIQQHGIRKVHRQCCWTVIVPIQYSTLKQE